MKLCPVCKTTVFEDMDTCYECMYKFDEGIDPRAVEVLEESADKMVEPVASTLLVGSPTLVETSALGASMPQVEQALTIATAPEGANLTKEMPDTSSTEDAPFNDNPARAEGWTLHIEMRSNEEPSKVWSFKWTPSASAEQSENTEGALCVS